MPAGHVQVAPDSTGKDIDADALTSTESGTPTVYRQNVVLGDPTAYGGKARVGTGGDQSASLTSPAAAAAGIFALIQPFGSLRVAPEATAVFADPFDGAVVDTANRWAAAGTQVPTQANGLATLAATVGASVNNTSSLISQPLFAGPGFWAYGALITLEAAQTSVVNVNRFWGKGQVTSFAYATPVTDGVGFEVEGTVGALQCVMWIGGTKYVLNSTNSALVSSSVAGAGGSGTALPTGAVGANYGALLTWKGGQHRYAILQRADVCYWFIEGTEVPVAVLTYAQPNAQSLPLRFASITNGAATSLAHTFQVAAVAVGDTTTQNHQVSDGTYPWRKAQVGKSGGLSVKGSSPAIQTLAVTAATPVTGAGLDVSEAGNCTFIVKNTVAATAYTGVPVIVFEQSDDNVQWAPLAVTDGRQVGPSPVIATGAANTSQMFDAALEGVNWVRVRVVTAQATNGMTVVTQPGGMAFAPSVATPPVVLTPLHLRATGTASGLTTVETAQNVAGVRGVTAVGSAASIALTAGKTTRITGIRFRSTGNATATTQTTIHSLRLNIAGAVVVTTTPVLLQARTTTPAVSLAADWVDIPLGQGFDIPVPVGGNYQIGVSANAVFVTTGPTWDVFITGYEF
jgi:hypothetical protein